MNVDTKKWRLRTDPVIGLTVTLENRETGQIKHIKTPEGGFPQDRISKQTERQFDYDCELAFEKGRWPR